MGESRRGLQGGWGPTAVGRLLWRGSWILGLIAMGGLKLLVRRPRSRAEGAAWVQWICAGFVRALGVEARVEGRFPAAGAVVTNHQGYLDILVLASLRPCVFVSKEEIAHWPVVGWMVAAAGTVFVRRGAGGSAAAASVKMRAAAEDGLPIVFFPEGTTSNGDELLAFRSGLLAEARAAELPVTVGLLRYTVSGPAGATVQDDVAYWGDRSLLGHMARILTLEGVRATVRFAERPVRFGAEDRKAAAAEAREAMRVLASGRRWLR